MSMEHYECWERGCETYEDRCGIDAFDHEDAACSFVRNRNDDGDSCDDVEIFVVAYGDTKDKARLFFVNSRIEIEYDSTEATLEKCDACGDEFATTRTKPGFKECESCKRKRSLAEYKKRMAEAAK